MGVVVTVGLISAVGAVVSDRVRDELHVDLSDMEGATRSWGTDRLNSHSTDACSGCGCHRRLNISS